MECALQKRSYFAAILFPYKFGNKVSQSGPGQPQKRWAQTKNSRAIILHRVILGMWPLQNDPLNLRHFSVFLILLDFDPFQRRNAIFDKFSWITPDGGYFHAIAQVNRDYLFVGFEITKELSQKWVFWVLVKSQRNGAITQCIQIWRYFVGPDESCLVQGYRISITDDVKA